MNNRFGLIPEWFCQHSPAPQLVHRIVTFRKLQKGSNKALLMPASERCEARGITKWFDHSKSTYEEAQWQRNYIMPDAH